MYPGTFESCLRNAASLVWAHRKRQCVSPLSPDSADSLNCPSFFHSPTAANQFGFTLDQVNWLGNVINVVYLPSAFFLPYFYNKLGIRGTVSITRLN